MDAERGIKPKWNLEIGGRKLNRASYLSRAPSPDRTRGPTVTKPEFWKIIASTKRSDPDEHVERLIAKLAKRQIYMRDGKVAGEGIMPGHARA